MERCYCCQDVFDIRDSRKFIDNAYEWRTVCPRCPSLMIHSFMVGQQQVDFDSTQYDERLTINPRAGLCGIWVMCKDVPIHNVHLKELAGVGLSAINQHGQRLVLRVADWDQWKQFRAMWLCKPYGDETDETRPRIDMSLFAVEFTRTLNLFSETENDASVSDSDSDTVPELTDLSKDSTLQ
jgi:hypothetical protein